VISDLTFRPIVPDELPAFVRADEYGFSNRYDEPLEDHIEWAGAELERTIAAFDNDEIVACGRNYSLELTLPGGAIVPAGGVSWISVRPTHRRRGILTAIMTALVDDSAERGESLSMLTASESGIYGRFGYGIATRVLSLRMARDRIRFSRPVTEGRVRLVEPADAAKVAPEVFDRVRAGRPGAVSRPASWWSDAWAPKEFVKQRFDALYERDGRVDGFVVYSPEGSWSDGFSEKTLAVHDLVAATPEAEAALWQFVCGVDLVREVTHWNSPPDLDLPWLLTEPRQMRTTSLRDWLWVRPVDVPAFLGARHYGADDAMVLEVHDDLRPDGAASGRFRVAGAADGGECTVTDADADLVLDPASLGAISLGGTAASALGRVGRIEERTAGALQRADRLFAAERAPHSFTWF
jgi:predicted acetyltransferase